MRWAVLLILVAAIQDPVQESPLAKAQAKFEEARTAEKSGGDFETPAKAAIAAFDEAVKADPGSVAARAGRGDVRAALGAWRISRGDLTKRAELEAAIADYDEALKLDPARVETIAGRGFARFKSAVARFFARVHVNDLFKPGFDDLDNAVKLRPDDAALRVLRADCLFEKATYARYRADSHREHAEAALAEYREAIRLDATRAASLDARIAACGKLADSPVAVEDRGPYIVWARTWELAKREAAIRRVPIFFYVSGGAG